MWRRKISAIAQCSEKFAQALREFLRAPRVFVYRGGGERTFGKYSERLQYPPPLQHISALCVFKNDVVSKLPSRILACAWTIGICCFELLTFFLNGTLICLAL